jgi:hypothetical protein
MMSSNVLPFSAKLDFQKRKKVTQETVGLSEVFLKAL